MMNEDEVCCYLVEDRRSCRAQPVVADYIANFGQTLWPLCEEHTKSKYHPPGVNISER